MKKPELTVYKDQLVALRARLRGDVSQMADAALKKSRTEANGTCPACRSTWPIWAATTSSRIHPELDGKRRGTLTQIEPRWNASRRDVRAVRGVRSEDSQDPAERHPLRHALRALRRTAGTPALKQAVPLSRYLVFFSLASGVCAADLTTKSWMFDISTSTAASGGFGRTCSAFQTSLNEGALFGMGQGFWPYFPPCRSSRHRHLDMALCVWRRHDWLLTVALAFMTAGILGNLYDRLGLPRCPATCPARLSTPSATLS